MATKYITHVRYAVLATGGSRHITDVLLDSGMPEPRASVILNIDNHVHVYYTKPPGNAASALTSLGGMGAKVHVVHGLTGKYLSTDANGRGPDNLGSLPEF